MPCISGNRLTCFISLKFSYPPCPWQPKFWNYNGESIFLIPFILVSKRFRLMRWFQIWSQNWNRITSAQFLPKICQNWQNTFLSNFSTVFFLPKMGLNVIPFQFWDKNRNPLIKAHLLDTKMKGIKKLYLFRPPCNSKTLVATGRVGMKILEKWNMSICIQKYRAR